jgi:predicted metal-dependent hydrolase
MTVTQATQTSQTQTSNADRQVPTRRVSFEESLRNVPKHFAADGDLIESHLAVCMSAVFPDGEDFFVRSVRHYRDRITDPALKRQVSGFIGQESVHGREHRALNDRFAELGYDTKRMERITRRGLAFRERVAPPISNLASTAALEHFTATLAELLLGSEEVRERFGDEAVRNVFVWHALEESEHKAVAFDVYKAVGGSERMRVVTMKLTRLGFVVGMSVSVLLSVLGDREAYRNGNLRRSVKRMRRSPLFTKQVWRDLCDYDRPDFHPDDRDTEALTAEWRERLFGEDGTLVGLLPGGTTAA